MPRDIEPKALRCRRARPTEYHLRCIDEFSPTVADGESVVADKVGWSLTSKLHKGGMHEVARPSHHIAYPLLECRVWNAPRYHSRTRWSRYRLP